MNKIKAIIFDFDGVIVDSVNVKTEAFAELYRPHGTDIEEKVINHHLNNGGMSRFEKFKIYHEEFLDKEISETEVNQLADEFSKLVIEKVINAPYIKGAHKFLKTYFKEYDFYISSGTPTDEIKKITASRGIDSYFKGIFGSPRKKEDHVKEIMENNNYDKEEVVFIGDASSDRKAARKNGVNFIGVLNENIDFSDERYTVNNLEELKPLLNKIEKKDEKTFYEYR